MFLSLTYLEYFLKLKSNKINAITNAFLIKCNLHRTVQPEFEKST